MLAHAASVGELRALEPVLAELRALGACDSVALTFSSRSMDWAPSPLVTRQDYAPIDEPGPAGSFLDALQPALFVIARGELWPEMLHQAARRAIPVTIVGGSIRPRSLRLRWPLIRLYRTVCRHLAYVGAVSTPDAERWVRLGAPQSVVRVTGDPRHDGLLNQRPDGTGVTALAEWCADRPALVVGSLESSDVSMVTAAAVTITADDPESRIGIVPHEPDGKAAELLCRRLTTAGIEWQVWRPEDPAPSAKVVVVAATGILMEIYRLGAAAYVGGGFRKGRLHTVAEPASLGLPVIVGPHWRGDPDATRLVCAGGAMTAGSGGSKLSAIWLAWRKNDGARRAAGNAARRALGTGAAGADARALAVLMQPT